MILKSAREIVLATLHLFMLCSNWFWSKQTGIEPNRWRDQTRTPWLTVDQGKKRLKCDREMESNSGSCSCHWRVFALGPRREKLPCIWWENPHIEVAGHQCASLLINRLSWYRSSLWGFYSQSSGEQGNLPETLLGNHRLAINQDAAFLDQICISETVLIEQVFWIDFSKTQLCDDCV